MKTLLAGLVLALPLAARADSSDGQVDIDAMEAQYKNMPGGDVIVKQMEAHRKEIEAGNKKAAAERKKSMADAGVDESAPLKPLGDLLAMVPEPPKDAAEAVKREGKVVDPARGGKTRHDGDVKSESAAKELMRQMFAAARHPLASNFKAGIITPEQRDALKTAQELSGKISKETTDAVSRLGRAGVDAQNDLSRKLGAISEKWRKPIGDACPDAEGVAPKDTVNCKPTIAKRNAELRAAREAYLKKIAPIAREWRGLGKSAVADGAAMHAALKKGYGDETKAIGYGQYATQADGSVRQIAAALLGLNDDAVNRASEKDPAGY
ncbi:MAG TPA: hypothetical protein VN915_11520 [Elusimicrobiota bacterium]|nr:hypothetical protein [Elusimicrobiota bacterium]